MLCMMACAGRMFDMLTHQASKIMKEGHDSYFTQVRARARSPHLIHLYNLKLEDQRSFARIYLGNRKITCGLLYFKLEYIFNKFVFSNVQEILAQPEFYRDFCAPRQWWFCVSKGVRELPEVFQLLGYTKEAAGECLNTPRKLKRLWHLGSCAKRGVCLGGMLSV